MPPVSQPVAALRQAADIADRVTADQLGQLEDLCHGQDRAVAARYGLVLVPEWIPDLVARFRLRMRGG